MRRLLASLLSLTLAAGPAAAQVAGRIAPISLAAPAILTAPAVSMAVTPLAAAPMFAAAPALPAAPLPPAAAASAPRAVGTLRAVATPVLAAAAFDGGRPLDADAVTANASAAPTPASGLAPSAARPEKPEASLPPVYKAFHHTFILSSLAGIAAPILWGAAPAFKGYLFTTTSLTVLAVVGGITLARWIARRFSAPPSGRPAPPVWSRRLKAAALGLMMGLSSGVIPHVYTGPIAATEQHAIETVMRTKAKTDTRAIAGTTMSDETIRVLSRNKVGLALLEHYRDRGGVLRLPTFFLTTVSDNEAAHYDGYSDGIFVNTRYLQKHDWSTEEFTRRPDLQRRLVAEIQTILVHELTHGMQARRPVTSRDALPFFHPMEREYEAYATQSLYIHEMLKADPHAELDGVQLAVYGELIGGDLMKGLAEYDTEYPANHRYNGAHWRAFYAEVNARWPALRVEGLVLMARRCLPADGAAGPRGSLQQAREYLEKARAVAKEAGLPAPQFEIPAGN